LALTATTRIEPLINSASGGLTGTVSDTELQLIVVDRESRGGRGNRGSRGKENAIFERNLI
jgi:hypothetical protein